MRWMAPVLMLLMLVVAAPEPAVAGDYSNMSKRAKSEINAIREKNGRKTVKPSFLLYKAARIHARDLVKNGLFNDFCVTARIFWKRIEHAAFWFR